MEKHCDAPTLLRYLDAELTPPEAAAVSQHLARCWRCRTESDSLQQQISEVTRIFTRCEIPETHAHRGLLRLQRALPPAPASHRQFPWRIGVALLAAGLLAAGSRYFVHTHRPAPPAPKQSVSKPKPVANPPVARIIHPRPTPRIPVHPSVIPAAPKPADDRLPLLHVEVLYALHIAAADLGEPITVRREAGRILVEGIADTRARLQQIRTVLDEIHAGASLECNVIAAEDAPLLPPTQPTLTLIATAAAPAIQSILDEHDMRFPTATAQSAVALSSSALDRAWAIRRLEAAFPHVNRGHLPAAGRWLLQQIEANHMEEIEAASQSLRAQLAPLLSLTPATPPPPLATFERTALVRNLIHSLFAGRQTPDGFQTPESMLATLHALLE